MRNSDMNKFFRDQEQTVKNQLNINGANQENITNAPPKENQFKKLISWLFNRNKKNKNR